MIRIFLLPENLKSDEISITGDQAKHLHVLRVKPGEIITAFDCKGYKYECRIQKCHKKEVIVEKLNKTPYSAESPVSITLAQGLPKADKMDLIIQKSTELGANKITPLIAERSQPRHADKTDRWRKIALAASQQSGRDRIPEIDNYMEFREFISRQSTALKLIFSEDQKTSNLKKILSQNKSTDDILLLIGPEGGFTKEEVHSALEQGFIEVSLGPRILRTETAPLAVLSIIQYELGDVG